MSNTLTAHEIEILLSSARIGMRETARDYKIKEQTVRNTLANVYRKLHARGMAHAILILSEGHHRGS